MKQYYIKCIILLFVLATFSSFLYAQVGLRTSGANINIPAGTSLIIPGNVNISGGTDYILNNGTCYIAGNFTNGGVSFSTLGNGAEIFNGNTTIGGSINSIFNNITINAGAIVAIVKSIDIKNDWTNFGKFIPNTNQVSFSGSVASQNIYGSGTFYDLVIQNITNFLASKDTIKNQFSNTASITGGTSRVVFDSAAKIIASYSKYFYDMEILSGANVNHTTGGGDIHIDNSYTNNGIYTEGPAYTTYFDKSGGFPFLSGSGTTTFGNITIGQAGMVGAGTALNANAHSFKVGGTAFTFNHSNSSFNGGTGTVTFNGTTDLITSAASVTGIAALFNNVTVLNVTTQAIDITVNGQLSVTNAANKLAVNGNTLYLKGTVTGSGFLTGSATSNIAVGSSGVLGTLYFDQTTNNTTNVLKNLTINSGATASIGNALNITAGTSNPYGSASGTVIVNGALSTGNNITLKSNQYGDAVIGQSSGSILFNATVERYIPGKRAWRFLTVPFKPNTGTQTINTAWQEGQVNTQLPCSFNQVGPAGAGYGTQITYNNLSATGYDVNTTTNPSIKVWSNNAWTTPGTTNTPLISAYPAYCLFVRGDRTICLDQGVAAGYNNTTLRATGILNQNGSPVTSTFSSAAAGDYIFVGNPYASPIDITNIIDGSRTTGYDIKKFWVWDPRATGNYGDGQYVTFSNGMQVPNGSGQTDGTYTGGTVIQSGQAFFLQLNNASTSTSVQFKEIDKTSFETNIFNRQSHKIPPSVYTNLMISSGDSLIMIDGVGAAFGNEYSANIDAIDASKLWNTKENIALLRNDYRLSIEFRPFPVLTDTFYYKLFLFKDQPYALKIFSQDLPQHYQAWLVDKYLDTKTAINLSDTMLYNFTPNADTNSYRNRFMLVFKHVFIATPVAVNEANDKNVSNNLNSTSLTSAVSIYPNPVIRGNRALIKLNNMIKGLYQATVTDASGKVLTDKTFAHDGGSNTYSIQTNSKWAAGNYIVAVTNNSNLDYTAKLIVIK